MSGGNRLFVLVYSKMDDNVKRYKAQGHPLPKDVIKNYNVFINRRNFYDHPVNSNIEQYEEIRKLTTGQDEDCTTGYLLDYDYIKNHCRLIDFSRQKELDADSKATQQI